MPLFDLIQTDEAKALVQQGLQADGEALGGIGGGFVHAGDDDVAAVDVLEAGGDGVASPEPGKPRRTGKRVLPSPAEVARLIERGELDGKVVSIRNHFRCSQQAARELRSKAMEELEEERQLRLVG